MAMRARQGRPPWDEGCSVETMTGGYETMSSIRDTFETVIADAKTSSLPFGQRGHVYIAGWRFNPQRDLSVANPWKTRQWLISDGQAVRDQTALGLVLRLMQAGVRVRIMVWLPTFVGEQGAGPAHVEDHFYTARAVAAENIRLAYVHTFDPPMGIVALDARVADGSMAASHHQKTIVVRSLDTHVAFCGGVDLAFTRRDAPADPAGIDHTHPRFLQGDWQSGTNFPTPAPRWPPLRVTWPPDPYTDYQGLDRVDPPRNLPATDLPQRGALPREQGEVDLYGTTNQAWHDQHLLLRGPIVATLEQQFGERWVDPSDVYDLSRPGTTFAGQVIFSTSEAFDDDDTIVPLEAPQPAGPTGSSTVQMWRTIPWRDSRSGSLFRRAEFTVMGGVARATIQSQQLIWIFDQYFWSLPYARLLRRRLEVVPSLHLVIVLPPWADASDVTLQGVTHHARNLALGELFHRRAELLDRVGVYNLWHPTPAPGRGIYCHAKAQTYDRSLLVCGSANLNRRSFNCDSELACAVHDLEVVESHQRRLWHLLFADVPAPLGSWPGVDLDQAGSGKAFFDAFRAAAADDRAFVRPDPWRDNPPALDNGAVRPVGGGMNYGFYYNVVFDPTSIHDRCERVVGEMDEAGRPVIRFPRLDEVVRRIETVVRTPRGRTVTPWRSQS
jgi:phosphatidylserine/phosphatidylglycerophosphate/cardiolipin synthase-like enzyme